MERHHFVRPRLRWKDNIKMDIPEVRRVYWIDLSRVRDRRRALLNAAMDLRLP